MKYITQLRAENGRLAQYSDFGVTWNLHTAGIAKNQGRFGKDAISIGKLKYLYSTRPPPDFILNNFTLLFWLYVEPNNSYGQYASPLFMHNYNFSAHESQVGSVYVYGNSGGVFRTGFNGRYFERDSSYFKSKWTFVAVTKKDLKFYTHIDGILESSIDIVNPSGQWNKPMSINFGGTYGNELRYRYTTGYIDDFNIVDEAVYDESNFEVPTKYFGQIDKYNLFNHDNTMYGIPNQ